MIDRYLAVFLAGLGAVFLAVGIYNLGRDRRRNLDGTMRAAHREPMPAWGFVVTGILLLFVALVLTLAL